MSLREHSIYNCIINNALNYSDEIAIVSGDLSLTYGEIPLHVNSLARGLLKTGFEKGDRIGVLLNNCLEYALLLAACARIGLITVCLNPRTSADEMLKILKQAKPKALIFKRATNSRLMNFVNCISIDNYTVLMMLQYFLLHLTNC